MPKSSETEKQTTGVNAMPPRRGTDPLWILRASGSSKRFRLNATSKIWGIKIPAKKTHNRNAEIELIIQNAIIETEFVCDFFR